MGNKNHLTDANGENLCVHFDTETNGPERRKESQLL